MDQLIQNGLSNLEIETHHPHSSSSSQNEDEVKRNWVELPSDVLSLIFMKLGTIDILGSAQWVCTSWWKLSKQPQLFWSIHVEQVLTLFCCDVQDFNSKLSEGLAREAIDRSGGQLAEFSIRDIATDELLLYMSEKSCSLGCIRLVDCFGVSADGLIEMAKKLPQLKDFEIINSSFITKYVIETYGRLCPRLKSCRLNYVSYPSKYLFHNVVVAIAQNMPELRHLNLFGNRLMDYSLNAVLDGCPYLESLDLRRCFDLKIVGDWKARCGNIKLLRLPNDPTGDFEYKIQHYPVEDFSDSDFDYDSYSDEEFYYGSDDFNKLSWLERSKYRFVARQNERDDCQCFDTVCVCV